MLSPTQNKSPKLFCPESGTNDRTAWGKQSDETGKDTAISSFGRTLKRCAEALGRAHDWRLRAGNQAGQQCCLENDVPVHMIAVPRGSLAVAGFARGQRGPPMRGGHLPMTNPGMPPPPQFRASTRHFHPMLPCKKINSKI